MYVTDLRSCGKIQMLSMLPADKAEWLISVH